MELQKKPTNKATRKEKNKGNQRNNGDRTYPGIGNQGSKAANQQGTKSKPKKKKILTRKEGNQKGN